MSSSRGRLEKLYQYRYAVALLLVIAAVAFSVSNPPADLKRDMKTAPYELFESGTDFVVNYLQVEADPLLSGIKFFLEYVFEGLQRFFSGFPVYTFLVWGLTIPLPSILMLAIPLAWLVSDKEAVLATVVGFGFVAIMGLWKEATITLSIVIEAASLIILFGIPIGIIMSKSDLIEKIVTPVLDFMQTISAFVYLIPVVILFGIGTTPAIVATCIFCSPPIIRLTNLGIRQISAEIREAGIAFGCNPIQLLLKVELPNASPTLFAGVNQTIMLSFAMSVMASLIGSGGLGEVVLIGISRLEVGTGLIGGVSVALIAIVLDRFTRRLGEIKGQA